MAVIYAFPTPRKIQPLRAVPRSSLSQFDARLAMKAVCEAIIFGCFLIAVVMTIYAFGG